MTRSASTMSALRASAVGDWEVCGDFLYCREQLYDMSWEEVDLRSKRVCCAAYGGPIATVRDESKAVVITSSSSMRPLIRIFSAAGIELGSVLWERGRILDWGWSSNLELAVVEESAKVLVFSMHGEKLREFTLGAAVEREGVKEVCVHGEGMVVLTKSNRLWAVSNIQAPRVMAMAEVPGLATASGVESVPKCCLAVVDARATLSGSIEVLLACGSTVWQVDEETATDHRPLGSSASPSSSISMLSISPDGFFVALYTDDARLIVLSTDFSKTLSEFETKADSPPVAIAWCGSDAVVGLWPELLLLIGPYGDHISWQMDLDDRLELISEVDGLRILGSMRHELLRKLPSCIVDVYRPGSTAPAAQLWEARDLYDAHIARSDKVLRGITADAGGLDGAVASCIEAAGLEMNVSRQKALLRAACYGRAYCSTHKAGSESSHAYDASSGLVPHLMFDTANKLRVLNALREPGVGVPLTMVQLNALTLPVVVSRLVVYRQWLVAYRIAGELRPSSHAEAIAAASKAAEGGLGPPASSSALTDKTAGQAMNVSTLASATIGPNTAALAAQECVLIQWACAKISAHAAAGATAVSDGELKQVLMRKLKDCPNIRFAPLAAHAQSVGRRHLAIKLLEEESSCALQVPLLLSLSMKPSKKGVHAQRPGAPLAEEDLLPGGPGQEAEDTLTRALRKAIESGDTDLVYLVLFHIYKHRALPDFLAIISSRTLARNLFYKYCRTQEPELLETILSTSGASHGLGAPELAELQFRGALGLWASKQGGHAAGENELMRLNASLGDVAHKFGTSREFAFQSKAVSEMNLLRKEQARLEKETGQQLFVGLSVMATIHACIKHGHHKQAAALKKLFVVSEKRFCWLKVRVLADNRDWEALDAYAAESSGRKVPVIGWEPFLEAAKRHSAPREILMRLIARFPDSSLKAEEFNAINCQREAAEVAAKLRDGDLFARIAQSVNTNSPAGLAIAQIRERFQATFR